MKVKRVQNNSLQIRMTRKKKKRQSAKKRTEGERVKKTQMERRLTKTKVL